MLTVLKDAQGQIEAACDWWLVDEAGAWTPLGRYVYVHQLEVSTGFTAAHMSRIIREIASLAPGAIGAYWERRAHGTLQGRSRITLMRFATQREEVLV